VQPTTQTLPTLPNGDPSALVTGLVQRFMFMWRHTSQVVVGALVAYLVAHYGLNISAETKTLLETGLFSLGVAAYGWAQHWLETRRGSDGPARMARLVARLMVLGAPAQPLYTVAR